MKDGKYVLVWNKVGLVYGKRPASFWGAREAVPVLAHI